MNSDTPPTPNPFPTGSCGSWQWWMQWKWRYQFSFHRVRCYLIFNFLTLCSAAYYAFTCSGFQNYLKKYVSCRFAISGRVVGAVGGESCSVKNGGPSNVKVDLLSPSGDLVSSVLTSPSGSYLFTNIIPGREICAFFSKDLVFKFYHSKRITLRLVPLLKLLPQYHICVVFQDSCYM